MKTLICLATAAFFLTACGGSNASEAKAPKTAAQAKPVVEITPAQSGAKVFKKCRSCHTLEEDGRNKVGPNLWNIYGAKTASKKGYAYSKAMKAADITWDETTMDAYLKKPGTYMPGNKMTFIGLKKQEDRDAVQAYLKEKTTP